LFVNEQEAMNYALEIHQLYNEFLKDVCYLPVLSGKKTEGEKFAGAEITYTREAWSQDGQCIQTGTSHYLGQNFSKIYDIKFQTKENNFAHPYYTSHGITTRIIGDLIVVHGDDKGIVLPFTLAPIQIAILPILGDKEPKVLVKAKEIADELDIYRVNIDDSTNSFGCKISNQEALGTPFSIVIGPKDLENNTCVLISRDNGEKQTIALEKIKEVIKNEKMNYFKRMYNKADMHLQNSIIETQTLDQFKENVSNGKISLCYWGGDENDEKKIKELTGASPRCIKEELVNSDKRCFFTNKPAKALVYFARAY
jgi:prolyl-tRNA synthetase